MVDELISVERSSGFIISTNQISPFFRENSVSVRVEHFWGATLSAKLGEKIPETKVTEDVYRQRRPNAKPPNTF